VRLVLVDEHQAHARFASRAARRVALRTTPVHCCGMTPEALRAVVWMGVWALGAAALLSATRRGREPWSVTARRADLVLGISMFATLAGYAGGWRWAGMVLAVVLVLVLLSLGAQATRPHPSTGEEEARPRVAVRR
jgi:hypothetical protein